MIACLALCGGMQADFTCDFLPFFDGILHAWREIGEANIEVINYSQTPVAVKPGTVNTSNQFPSRHLHLCILAKSNQATLIGTEFGCIKCRISIHTPRAPPFNCEPVGKYIGRGGSMKGE